MNFYRAIEEKSSNSNTRLFPLEKCLFKYLADAQIHCYTFERTLTKINNVHKVFSVGMYCRSATKISPHELFHRESRKRNIQIKSLQLTNCWIARAGLIERLIKIQVATLILTYLFSINTIDDSIFSRELTLNTHSTSIFLFLRNIQYILGVKCVCPMCFE